MVRKGEYVKQGDLYVGKWRAGVRASIVAMKRRNGCGAKGGREVDTCLTDKRKNNRFQCPVHSAGLNRSERFGIDGPGLNRASGRIVC